MNNFAIFVHHLDKLNEIRARGSALNFHSTLIFWSQN